MHTHSSVYCILLYMALLDWSKLNSSYSNFYPPPLTLSLSLSLCLSHTLSHSHTPLCLSPPLTSRCALSLITTNESQASNMFTSNTAPGQSSTESSQFTQCRAHGPALLSVCLPHYVSQSIERQQSKRETCQGKRASECIRRKDRRRSKFKHKLRVKCMTGTDINGFMALNSSAGIRII